MPGRGCLASVLEIPWLLSFDAPQEVSQASDCIAVVEMSKPDTIKPLNLSIFHVLLGGRLFVSNLHIVIYILRCVSITLFNTLALQQNMFCACELALVDMLLIPFVLRNLHTMSLTMSFGAQLQRQYNIVLTLGMDVSIGSWFDVNLVCRPSWFLSPQFSGLISSFGRRLHLRGNAATQGVCGRAKPFCLSVVAWPFNFLIVYLSNGIHLSGD